VSLDLTAGVRAFVPALGEFGGEEGAGGVDFALFTGYSAEGVD